MDNRTVLAIGVLAAVVHAFAGIEFGAPFADGAVLQREMKVPVWGKMSPVDGKVPRKVRVEFAGQSKTSDVGKDGSWRVDLDPMAASKECRTMIVRALDSGHGDDSVLESAEIRDILVGEVWFASGQSNMECPLWCGGTRYRDMRGGLMTTMTRLPNVRYVKCGHKWSVEPSELHAKWCRFTPEFLQIFHRKEGKGVLISAVAFYYARELYLALDVPIGIVDASWGGTNIDAWTPRSGYEDCDPSIRATADYKVKANWEKERDAMGAIGDAHQQPTVLYNGMVAAFAPMAMRGFIWYQGCNNSGEAGRYCAKLHALYRGWSRDFGNPDLRLYLVQLAPWTHNWLGICAAQNKFVSEEKNAALAVTADVGNFDDIHPNDKEIVAKRLVVHALKRDYGFDIPEDNSPVLRSAEFGDGKARLKFDNVKDWYVYAPDRSRSPAFELAGRDGRWQQAEIDNFRGKSGEDAYFIDGDTIVLSCDKVAAPVKVRYMGRSRTSGILYNEASLPVGPFEAVEASLSLDAPRHVAVEGEAVFGHGATGGSVWNVSDWRGRDIGMSIVADADGRVEVPGLESGYYRLRCCNSTATLAVVPDPKKRVFDRGSFYAVDSAQSWVSQKGKFLCPWNGGDTYRTISDLAMLAGIPHVRDRMSWNEVNPEPGKYADFDVKSQSMRNAQLLHERGIDVSGVFHFAPKWTGVRSRFPLDLVEVFRFARHAAAVYGDRMSDWEFWNEQDFSNAPEPAWDYTAVLKAAYLGFKSARPEMPVLNGALCQRPDSPYAFSMLDNDAARFFDVFNYHTYIPPAKYEELFKSARDMLSQYGARDYPIWITECGTYQEGDAQCTGAMAGFNAHSPDQELVLAEYYPKAQIAMQMEGVARNYHFLFGAYSEANGAKDWGVMRRDGTVKPVYSAISTMTRELVSAELEGEMSSGDGVKAYLFRQKDGSQVVVFWSMSELDRGMSPVSATREFRRSLSIRTKAGEYGLSDMCGMRSSVTANGGVLRLEATRFSAYVSGLAGLRPDIKAKPRGVVKSRALAKDEDMSVVIRVDFDERDFSLSNQKTRAVMKGDSGRVRVIVWNLDDKEKSGVVEVTGARLDGLPKTPFRLGAIGSGPAHFDCVLSPGENQSAISPFVLTGMFNGRRSSRFCASLMIEKLYFESLERHQLDCGDPKFWKRNTSAHEYKVSLDEKERAVRFDVKWTKPNDRWFYPVYKLKLPKESLSGARMIAFEVKTDQDKPENDFNSQYVMLLYKDGREARYFPYQAPVSSWERRFVEIGGDGDDLNEAIAFRLGVNPRGRSMTFWVRNIEVLK